MKKRKNILKFNMSDDIAIDTLILASNNIPKWYKEIPRFYSNDPSQHIHSHTIKQCVPFLDAMVAGYHILLPVDIYVAHNSTDNIDIQWRSVFVPVIERKNEDAKHIVVPTGYNKSHHLVWKLPVAIDIPEGYSALIVNPINRTDLPFYTLAGIIDGPYTLAVGGNLPFFIQEGFTGEIKQGTPIAQIIPFKREHWNIEKDDNVVVKGQKNKINTRSVISGWYKNNHWKKKLW